MGGWLPVTACLQTHAEPLQKNMESWLSWTDTWTPWNLLIMDPSKTITLWRSTPLGKLTCKVEFTTSFAMRISWSSELEGHVLHGRAHGRTYRTTTGSSPRPPEAEQLHGDTAHECRVSQLLSFILRCWEHVSRECLGTGRLKYIGDVYR